jgi:hypothetical protein
MILVILNAQKIALRLLQEDHIGQENKRKRREDELANKELILHSNRLIFYNFYPRRFLQYFVR